MNTGLNGIPAWLRILGIIITLAGLGVAAYMSWAELTGTETVCPGHTEDATGEPGTIVIDCGFVQQSIYASIFGIPVALLGIAGYLAIAAIWLLEKRVSFLTEYSALLIFGLSLFGFLFSLYLTYTELFIMYTICTWCVASAVLMTLVFVIASIQLVLAMRVP
ncbi:MAG: vitamin K epoxide reductase family protein [Anaerolineae bacterium]|nr:vitamin K epoxide reductase family protein [Anaerolineae bacterium]